MSKPHSQMASFGWLYMGLGAIAICLGYMIGASNSPVVGSIAPAVFGLVILSFGVLKIPSSPHATPPVDGKKTESPKSDDPMISFGNTRRLGIMLFVFSGCYLGSALFGTEVRARAVAKEPAQFPWIEKNKPANLGSALEWLVIQKRLEAYGYTSAQVRQLYELAKTSPDQQSVIPNFVTTDLLQHVPEPGATVKHTDICLQVGCLAGGDPVKETSPTHGTATYIMRPQTSGSAPLTIP